MVARRDQQQRGGVRAGAVQGEQARGTGGDEGDDERIQALQLAVEEFRAPSQLPQRDAGGVADHVARPRPQRERAGPVMADVVAQRRDQAQVGALGCRVADGADGVECGAAQLKGQGKLAARLGQRRSGGQ